MHTAHRSRLAVAAIAAAAAIVAAAFVATPAAAGHDTIDALRAENRRLRVELQAYQDAYRVLAAGLDRVEHEAHRIRDRRAHRRVHRAIERARDDAQEYVDRHDDDHDHDPDPDPDDDDNDDRPRRALTGAELRAVVDRIDAASYADDQLDLVRSVGRSSWFSVDQVVAIMKACDWDDTRIEAAVILYPRLVDPENVHRIYAGLTYASSRMTLRARLGL